jgi:hypothetical protein
MFVSTNYCGGFAKWKGQWNWLITADNCKQMLLLGDFH